MPKEAKKIRSSKRKSNELYQDIEYAIASAQHFGKLVGFLRCIKVLLNEDKTQEAGILANRLYCLIPSGYAFEKWHMGKDFEGALKLAFGEETSVEGLQEKIKKLINENEKYELVNLIDKIERRFDEHCQISNTLNHFYDMINEIKSSKSS